MCVCVCVFLSVSTSITINGKSALSSHPVEGQIRHATFKIRGQQAAVLGTSKSLLSSVELDTETIRSNSQKSLAYST